jgi:hypothetical protein
LSIEPQWEREADDEEEDIKLYLPAPAACRVAILAVVATNISLESVVTELTASSLALVTQLISSTVANNK